MNIVYKVTSPSGRVYIGQTYKSLEERKEDHVQDTSYGLRKGITSQPFHSALAKYGPENFTWEVVAENLSDEEANSLETKLIEEFDSFNTGYNATTGGKRHWKHSQETKDLIAEKASDLSKKMWEDPSHRENMRQKTKQSWQDPDTRKNMSDKIKEARSSPEQRKLTSEDNKRRYKDPKKCEEMAAARGIKPFEVFKDRTSIGKWNSAGQCARDLGLHGTPHIGRCLRGLEEEYCGYKFKFI